MAKPKKEEDKTNTLWWALGLTAAGLGGWWVYRKFFAQKRRKAIMKEKVTYKLTAGDESWTWDEDELDDTLYESEHWESKRAQVDAMDVGDKLVVEGEVLERLS
jgi:hypothetical protein